MGGKLKAFGLLGAMFVLGLISGVAWDFHKDHHRGSRMFFAEKRMVRMKKALHLSPWQERTFDTIVQDARERAQDINEYSDLDLAAIRHDSMRSIRQMLTPEQTERLEKLHARHHPIQPEPPESLATPGKSAHPTPAALAASNVNVRAKLDALHQALQDYIIAAKQSGPESPQAAAAKTRWETARQVWHTALQEQSTLRKQIHHAMRAERQRMQNKPS